VGRQQWDAQWAEGGVTIHALVLFFCHCQANISFFLYQTQCRILFLHANTGVSTLTCLRMPFLFGQVLGKACQVDAADTLSMPLLPAQDAHTGGSRAWHGF
jgi:hypothetical protein